MKNEKHLKACAEYVFHTEGEDFKTWLFENGSDLLDSNNYEYLELWADGKFVEKNLLHAAFEEASTYNVFASSWLIYNS